MTQIIHLNLSFYAPRFMHVKHRTNLIFCIFSKIQYILNLLMYYLEFFLVLRFKLLIIGLFLLLPITGCGQKGGLYLPQKNLQKAQQPQSQKPAKKDSATQEKSQTETQP